MEYQKLAIELIVNSEEADAVVARLNSAIDVIEESHAIFGGEIEVVALEHSGTPRKSALRQVLDARKVATAAVKSAAHSVIDTYKKVV